MLGIELSSLQVLLTTEPFSSTDIWRLHSGVCYGPWESRLLFFIFFFSVLFFTELGLNIVFTIQAFWCLFIFLASAFKVWKKNLMGIQLYMFMGTVWCTHMVCTAPQIMVAAYTTL